MVETARSPPDWRWESSVVRGSDSLDGGNTFSPDRGRDRERLFVHT